MGEFEFIEGIRAMFSGIGAREGMEGIGDDCAVMSIGGGRSIVITTDMLVEGSHFLRAAASAQDIGRKSLAVNLSDVAAMGAKPVAALLSIALPKDCQGEWAGGFMEGFRDMARTFDVALIGGDTTASPAGISINVVAIGIADDVNIKRRRGARPGDMIAVTGMLGDSAAGLKEVLAGNYSSPLAHLHHNPQPYVCEGIWLGGRAEVHAMIDLSDGLSSDLGHILKASGVGAIIDLEAVPTAHSLQEALAGGEDYKLLFTFDGVAGEEFASLYRREVGGLYVVGRIVEGQPTIKWMRGGEIVEADWHGFTHF